MKTCSTKTIKMKVILKIILLALVVGCTNVQNPDNKKNILPYVKIGEALDNRKSNTKSLIDFIDSVKYIPLETTPECNIEEIKKIISYNGNFYIWDYNAILKFNSNGKFICQIGKMGRGPKEYGRNREMTIRKDTLFVNEGKKIVAFNADDGSFIQPYSFPDRWFAERLNGHFVSINSKTGFIEFVNNRGSVTNSLDYEHFSQNEIYPDMMIYPVYNVFFGTPGALKISTSHNDTIFEINRNHQLIPRYIFDMGDYKLPEKERLEYSGDFMQFQKITSGFVRPVPLETTRFLIVQLGKWGAESKYEDLGFRDNKADLLGLGIFDKKTDEFFVISEDNENYPCFFPHVSDEENRLISWGYPVDLISFYNENKEKYNFCVSFTHTVKSLEMEDNPVIIEVKLKE